MQGRPRAQAVGIAECRIAGEGLGAQHQHRPLQFGHPRLGIVEQAGVQRLAGEVLRRRDAPFVEDLHHQPQVGDGDAGAEDGGHYQARVLMVCTGYLHQPKWPALPGLASFPGPVFHSSQWDHSQALAGQRVAVVGSGASAVQFVPEIQPQVARLHLFQRTPHWVLPKPDHAIPPIERRLWRLPGGLAAYRAVLYAAFETFGIGFRRPRLMWLFERLARLQLRWQVRDPALRGRLSPMTALSGLLRRTMTAIVDREVAALQAAGIRVIRIEPGSDDLAAFGINMMDPRRRLQVFEVASRTAPAQVAAALAASCFVRHLDRPAGH